MEKFLKEVRQELMNENASLRMLFVVDKLLERLEIDQNNGVVTDQTDKE